MIAASAGPGAAIPLATVAPATSAAAALSPPLLIGFALIAAVSLLATGVGAVMLRRRAGHAVEEVQRLKSLFDVLAEGIVVCGGMQALAVNTSLCRLIGIGTEDVRDLMISSFIDDAEAIDRLLSDHDVEIETQVRPRKGPAIDVEISARTVQHGGSPQRLLEIRDIRQRKETQEQVSFLAHHDPLTGLPNREVLRARLAQAVEQGRETGQRCAIIWVDLDRFKEINDVHGHATGDNILRAVAEKLKFELPADAVIARLGGDEFVVLCVDIRDPEEARLIGQQLRRLLNRPIHVEGIAMTVGASIGVAAFPDDAATVDDLLKNADLALYHAKAAGRAKCRHFTETLGKERQRRMALSQALRGAIENGDIQVHFQPLVDTRDLRACGFEALARWFHPEFGAVPPPEFVRLAEETSLISPLTDLIMNRAIDAASLWPSDVRVSVNVSPVQINSSLVDRVREIIKTRSFDPRRLELEVTEDVLINDFGQTASMFARLRALGVQVAMDDFGAGYTSMGNLRRLNFERIKIDRIFTADLPNHRRSAAIVRSMFVLARELDLRVTVEGVETPDQFAFLCAEGCTEIQGFLFSQPKPLAAFIEPAALQLGPIGPPQRPAAPSAALIDLSGRRAKRAS